MISWRFIKRGFVYAWDVGTGVKWAMVHPLVLTSSIWLIVYTYLGISVLPSPPLDLPRQQQDKHSQRSHPNHRRSHQCHISLLPLTLLHTIQRKSDAAIVSGPSILVDEIFHSHIAFNICEPYPSDPRRAQLHLTSDWPPSQTQTVVLGLPTSQNIFAIASITIYSLPTIKRMHSAESS